MRTAKNDIWGGEKFLRNAENDLKELLQVESEGMRCYVSYSCALLPQNLRSCFAVFFCFAFASFSFAGIWHRGSINQAHCWIQEPVPRQAARDSTWMTSRMGSGSGSSGWPSGPTPLNRR